MHCIEDVINKLDRLADQIEALLLGQADRPLPFDEARRYLDVSASTLYKMTSQNLIRHSKPNGKKLFFEKADLDAYLRRNPVRSADEIESEAVKRTATAGRKAS